MAFRGESTPVFLKGLSDHLRKQEVQDLIYLCNIPEGESEDIKDGSAVFKWLKKQGKLKGNDLSLLADLLSTIYRKDLSTKVKQYMEGLKQDTAHSGAIPRFQAPENPAVPIKLSVPVEESQESRGTPTKVNLMTPATFIAKPSTTGKMSLPTESAYSTRGKTITGAQELEESAPQEAAPVRERISLEAVASLEDDESMTAAGGPALVTNLPYQAEVATGVTGPSSLRNDNVRRVRHPRTKLYGMSKQPRGICVIFSNHDFSKAREQTKYTELEDREGTEVDVQNLIKTFKWLKFDVENHVYRDKSGHEIWKILLDYSKMDHTVYDCFVCIVLSHGLHSGIYGVDGKPLYNQHIFGLFNATVCPTLADKPKLFFVQACRGEKVDTGLRIDEVKDLFSANGIPQESDYFIGYATPPGFVSWRSKTKGSWFISRLCETLADNAEEHHLCDIMIMVNDAVAKAYTKGNQFQVPNPTHTMRKFLYFFPELFEQQAREDVAVGLPSLETNMQNLVLN